MANFAITGKVLPSKVSRGDARGNKLYDEINAAESDQLVFTRNGNTYTLTGTDFTYSGTPGEDDFALTGGTVTGITITDGNGNVELTGTELDRHLVDFNEAITENELNTFVQTLLDQDDTITGDAGRDNLLGGDGDDTLDGGDGRDFMAGGEGDDVYIAHRGDKIVELADGGIDTVQSSTSFKLQRNVENLDLTGEGNARAIGNNQDNVINGNDANNAIKGRSGSDILNGNGGDDRIFGGAGDDVISGGDGTDELVGGDGADIFVFGDFGAGDVNTVRDFTAGVDMIDVTAVAGMSTFEDVLAQADQVGDHVVISTENDSDLILRNTDLDDLSADMFLFAA